MSAGATVVDVLLLAAGFGTRLRPLTLQRPKALLPLLGLPLLEHHLRRFLDDPLVGRVVVNGHHLADQLQAFIDAHPRRARLRFSPEPAILGTGGALAGAAALLASDPLLVQNADALFPVPPAEALAFHRARGCLATMILARSPLWPNVQVEGDRVTRIARGERLDQAFTFTGCYLISRDATAAIPRQSFHDIRDTFDRLIAVGDLAAFVWPAQGEGPLLDVGTPEAYLEAHRLCAGGGARRYGIASAAADGPPTKPARASGGYGFVAPSAIVGEGCRIDESLVLDGAIVVAGSVLRRAIVGPGARAEGWVENRVVTTLGERPIQDADEALASFARRVLALSAGPPGEARGGADAPPAEGGEPLLTRLAGDGSPRRIYRARFLGVRAVAVANPPPPARPRPDENEGFLAVREYLEGRGVRVPRLYAADLDAGMLLLEDLGDLRLYERVQELGWGRRSSSAAHEESYRQAIRFLTAMQSPGRPPFSLAAVPNPPYTEGFILEHEARYFHDELVRGFAGVDHDFGEITGECRALARAALSGIDRTTGIDRTRRPDAEAGGCGAWNDLNHAEAILAGLTFMHRDYQSRNLMLAAGGLAVIDFQGARRGPPEYDLASLLFDPYARMPGEVRERLIRFYCAAASAAGVPGIPTEPSAAWRGRLLAHAANRLMQALGAFAKLGVRLGRPGFREHIPAALEALGDCLERLEAHPRLLRLVREIRLTTARML